MSTSSSEHVAPAPGVHPSERTPSSSYQGLLGLPRVALRPSNDVVTLTEAATILGCSTAAVEQLVVSARTRNGHDEVGASLPRETVETLASEVYSWRLHIADGASYWITGQRAADALGLSRARLSQLANDRRVPFVRHQDGTRLYRREQLERIGSSGSHRRGSTPSTPVGLDEIQGNLRDLVPSTVDDQRVAATRKFLDLRR